MIDTHLHVWDPAGGEFGVEYPWLTPAFGALYRPFALGQVDADMTAAGVDGVVLVQASDSVAETRALLAAAKASPRPAAVVGWLPVADPAALTQSLADFAGRPELVGVRHLIHDEKDTGWLLRRSVAIGLDVLAEGGMVFDAVAERLDLLEQVAVVARRHPGLTVVLDHLGKPPFGRPSWTRWADLVGAAAAEPNVVAKISGLGTISDSHLTAGDWQPAVDVALREFGAERLMVGSDWPISLVDRSYRATVQRVLDCFADVPAVERQLILTGTASRVYRLSAAGPSSQG